MAEEQKLLLREYLEVALENAKEKFLSEGMKLQRENENYGPSVEKMPVKGELQLSELGIESKTVDDDERSSPVEMELKRKITEQNFLLQDVKLKKKKDGVMLFYKLIEMKREERGFTSSGGNTGIEQEEALEYLLDRMKWKRETSTQTSAEEMQLKQEEAALAFILDILEWKREDSELKASSEEKYLNRQQAPLRFIAKEVELERRIAKLDFRLKENKFEREEAPLQPAAEVKNKKIAMELKKEKGILQSQLQEMKLERGKRMLQFQLEEIEFERVKMEQESVEEMSLKQELAETECDLQNEKLKSVVVKQAHLISRIVLANAKSQTTAAEKTELKREKAELESLVGEIHLKHSIAKLDLLFQDISRRDETGLQSSSEALELAEHVRELEFQLQDVKLERLAANMEFLFERMNMKNKKSKLKALAVEMKLKRDLAEWELQLKKMRLKRKEEKLEPSLEEIYLERMKEELESKVEVMKLKRMIDTLKFIAGEIDMEEESTMSLDPKEETIELAHIETELRIIEEHLQAVKRGEKTLKGLPVMEMTAHESSNEVDMGRGVEMKATMGEKLTGSIETRHIFVLGGRGQDGESLRSVEGYVLRAGQWIHLPPMNTPRSLMSSVLVGSEIVVSGGDTGHEITDTIETLNLDEAPLKWITSSAKLPVPLSSHQTVVYKGRLIAIGGHDGKEGFHSDKIYEIPLTPPYQPNTLCYMPQPRAGHGAELIGDEIFIFGGMRNLFIPNDDVLVYNLVTRKFRVMESLPYAVHGMATVKRSGTVILLGGIDQNEEELDQVITYNTQSGEVKPLPSMKEKRGSCCALRSVMPDSTAGCSSDETAGILVALGSLRNIKTTECYDFRSQKWKDMPPLRNPRIYSTIVASTAELEFFE